jgi:hypothetical protein
MMDGHMVWRSAGKSEEDGEFNRVIVCVGNGQLEFGVLSESVRLRVECFFLKNLIEKSPWEVFFFLCK